MVDWRFAIRNRHLVGFRYEELERVIVPAAYGLNQKTGNELVRGYQVGGRDATRVLPAWSLFRADHVIGGTMLETTFEKPPPGYRRGDRALDVIYAQL